MILNKLIVIKACIESLKLVTIFFLFLIVFPHKGTVEINGKLLSAERLITTFMNYVTNQKLFEKASLDEKAKLREEFNQEFHMSQLFTPKQKDIIRKKMAAEPLTKTEREYYSRTIRKKILALADPELHRLAQKLLEL